MEHSPESIGEVNKNKFEEKPRNNIDDILSVGATKPLGWLTFSLIAEHGETPEHLIALSNEKGLISRIYHAEDTLASGVKPQVSPGDPMLYVYDEKALGSLLTTNRVILEKFRWPTDPSTFVDAVASKDALGETALFDVVADAFADYYNPGRLRFPNSLTLRQKMIIGLNRMLMSLEFHKRFEEIRDANKMQKEAQNK